MNKAFIFCVSIASFPSLLLAADNPQEPKWPLFNPQSIKDSDHIWMDLEALYWQANEDDLSYGTTSDSTARIADGHVKRPDFGWDWGVRFGIGYKLPHDKWDLYLGYTYVHANAHSHFDEHGKVIYPSWQAGFATSGGYAAQASSSWHTHLNIGDLELGRTCLASKWLSLRPFMGVRGIAIDQHGAIEYRGGTAVPVGDEYKNNLKNDCWGVGLRMGLDTLWGLGYGIGIYGNGAASLLSGNFDLRQKEKLNVAGTTFVNIEDHENTVIAIAELALGIQWDYLFSKDRYHFGLKFGWEFNVFFDQNRLMRLVDTTNAGAITQNDGDLSFQGLTFGMRFDF